MKYLNRRMKTLRRQPDFNFHPKCEKLNVTHLGFYDDLLSFCRGDPISVRMIYECFQEFSKSSGMAANTEKSSIYFGGVCREDQEDIMQSLGFTKGELPFRYLGIPLSDKKTSVVQFKPLMDRMLSQITSWTAKFLSYVGRVQLIKSVPFKFSGRKFLYYLRKWCN